MLVFSKSRPRKNTLFGSFNCFCLFHFPSGATTPKVCPLQWWLQNGNWGMFFLMSVKLVKRVKKCKRTARLFRWLPALLWQDGSGSVEQSAKGHISIWAEVLEAYLTRFLALLRQHFVIFPSRKSSTWLGKLLFYALFFHYLCGTPPKILNMLMGI